MLNEAFQNIARIVNAVTISCQVRMIVRIQVLNRQNCNQCLKCHKSPGLSCVAIAVSAHCRTQFKMPHTIVSAPVARKNPATVNQKGLSE